MFVHDFNLFSDEVLFGVAIATGCTFILKPSEKDPGVPMRLAELMLEAGAPPGVLNVVNGDKEAVDFISNIYTSNGVTSQQAMARTLELYQGKGRGSDMASAKGTAYGLLNAVTEFVDHERRARGNDYRLDSAWFGVGANLKDKAQDQAMVLVA